MDGTGFLKTVNFGGFDKKDVIAYVDQLNTKIYTLENELEEKKALLENSGGNMEDKESMSSSWLPIRLRSPSSRPAMTLSRISLRTAKMSPLRRIRRSKS